MVIAIAGGVLAMLAGMAIYELLERGRRSPETARVE